MSRRVSTPGSHRLSARDEKAFQRSLAEEELADELGPDPRTERYGQPRKESQTNRVLRILDGLNLDGEAG